MKVRHSTLMTALVYSGIALTCAGLAPSGSAEEITAEMSADAKFRALDANHDGFLTKDELKRYPHYGEAFDEADQNHDGRLSSAEFVKAESIYQRELAGHYVDDSIITAKVKAALIKQMKSLEVKVETKNGRVLLSGFVPDEAQRAQAIQVARSVDGVVDVENGLVIAR